MVELNIFDSDWDSETGEIIEGIVTTYVNNMNPISAHALEADAKQGELYQVVHDTLATINADNNGYSLEKRQNILTTFAAIGLEAACQQYLTNLQDW